MQLLITVAIIITAILEHIAMYVKEIPRITNKTVQVEKSMTMKASRNKFLQNIKENYKTAALAITIATNTMDCTKLRDTAPNNQKECSKFSRHRKT